jgi:hypothetical protein
VTQSAFPTSNGYHTNFVFSDVFTINNVPGTFLKAIGEASAHENGHGLNLDHQSLYNAQGNKVEEYDPGTSARGPIMGDSYSSTRGLWRVGTSSQSSTTIQNDIKVIMANSGIGGYVDSGIGHTRQTATALPMNGTAIDFTQAKGVVTPVSVTNPTPLGESNYTTDFFQVVIGPGGASVSVTLRSGRSTLTPGVADPGATLDATLRLLDANGAELQIANSNTFAETITSSNLAEGTYYFQISSAGADAVYFDVGSYFLTGNIVPVPEPALALLAGVLGLGFVARRRRRAVPA